MAVPYEKVVAEDLNTGTGTVTVTNPAGGTLTGTKINLTTFAADVALASLAAAATAGRLSRVNDGKRGLYMDQGSQWFQLSNFCNVMDFNANGNGRDVTDGVTTASSTTLTSATGAFTGADVSKGIAIDGGGAASRSVTDGVTTNASTTVTSATANFLTSEIGNKITLAGAGPSGGTLTARITQRTSATSILISTAASATLTGVTLTISGTVFATTINSVTNSTTIVLAAAPSATLTGATVSIGDDTTAIQNAINAMSTLGGGTVLFPEGTFYCAQVQLKSNVNLRGCGPGTVLKLLIHANKRAVNSSVAASNFFSDNVLTNTNIYNLPSNAGRVTTEANATYATTQVTISDMTVDGNRSNNFGTDSAVGSGGNDSTAGSCIGLSNAAYVTIQRCRLVSPRLFCVFLGYDSQGGSDYCRILDNFLDDYLNTGIAQIAGKYNLFSRNIITAGAGGTVVIDIEANATNNVNYRHEFSNNIFLKGISISASTVPKQQDCIFSNNFFIQDSSQTVVGLKIDADTGAGAVVVGNVFITAGTNDAFSVPGGAGGGDITRKVITYAGNTCVGFRRILAGTGSSAPHQRLHFIGNSFDSTYGMIFTRPFECLVQDNFFRLAGGDSTTTAFSMIFNDTTGNANQKYVRFSGNMIRGASVGSVFSTTSTAGASTTPLLARQDITIEDNVVDVTVGNNTLDMDQSCSVKDNLFVGIKVFKLQQQLTSQGWHFEGNVIHAASNVDAFTHPGACNEMMVLDNVFQGTNCTLTRPKYCSVRGNTIINGKVTCDHTGAGAAGVGGNIYAHNVSIATATTTNAFVYTSTAAANYATDDVIVWNTHIGSFTTPFSTDTYNARVFFGDNTFIKRSIRQPSASTPVGGGTYAVGDHWFFTDPTAGGTAGRICTTAGTPGTWTEFAPSMLKANASLNFGSTAAQSSADLTITVTGAALGDYVVLGLPDGATLTNSCFTAWVSAADTVKVRFSNYSSGAQDPAAGTFNVTILKP